MPSSLAHVKVSVRRAFLMADTFDMDPKHSRTIAPLLQEDEPEEPTGAGNSTLATLWQLEKLQEISGERQLRSE